MIATLTDAAGGRIAGGQLQSLVQERRVPLVTAVSPAPPHRRGQRRTVLLEATGYYNVVVPVDDEPQRDAFRRLVEEPGAVARFALERMRPRPTGTGS